MFKGMTFKTGLLVDLIDIRGVIASLLDCIEWDGGWMFTASWLNGFIDINEGKFFTTGEFMWGKLDTLIDNVEFGAVVIREGGGIDKLGKGGGGTLRFGKESLAASEVFGIKPIRGGGGLETNAKYLYN